MSSLQVLVSCCDLVTGLLIDCFTDSAHMHSTVLLCTLNKPLLSCRSLLVVLFPLFLFPARLMLFVVHDKDRLSSFRSD